MAYTGMAEMPARVRTYYERTLLDEARSELVHDTFALKKSIKQANGDQMLFRDIPDLPAITTPITGISDPVSQALSKNDQVCTLAKYGGFVTVEDMVEFTVEDPIITVATERCGRQAGLSKDTLLRDYLNSGTNVQYANGVTARTAIVSKITDLELYRAARTLKRIDARQFKRMILPTGGVGTTPIPAAFFAIVHPDIAYDLRALGGYIPVEEYPKQQEVYPQEIGAHKSGIRFLETTNAKRFPNAGGARGTTGLISTNGANIDVYPILVFSEGAFATVPLDGHALENIYKDKSKAGSALDLYSTVGWKMITTFRILRETRMLRIEVGATQ